MFSRGAVRVERVRFLLTNFLLYVYYALRTGGHIVSRPPFVMEGAASVRIDGMIVDSATAILRVCTGCHPGC